MDFGLDFGETLPAPVIHDGADEPGDKADYGAEDEKHCEALKDVAPHLDVGTFALGSVEAAVGGVSEVERGIAGDFGVGVEEGPEGRIGRQVGLIIQKRGVEGENAFESGRVAVEDAENCARVCVESGRSGWAQEAVAISAARISFRAILLRVIWLVVRSERSKVNRLSANLLG